MRVRRPLTITSRSSSVANAFVHAILPDTTQLPSNLTEALAILGMSPESTQCVYCGDPTTDWDHFRPLVRGARPTGYGHGADNLVPACGPCNQSKGGAEWRTWMLGRAPNSPMSRQIADLAHRLTVLERFEAWTEQQPIDFAKVVSKDVWDTYWARLEAIKLQLAEAQRDANVIRAAVVAALNDRTGS